LLRALQVCVSAFKRQPAEPAITVTRKETENYPDGTVKSSVEVSVTMNADAASTVAQYLSNRNGTPLNGHQLEERRALEL